MLYHYDVTDDSALQNILLSKIIIMFLTKTHFQSFQLGKLATSKE